MSVSEWVMLWASLDCAVRAVREDSLPGPADRWETLRDEIRDEIEANGFDHERNTYTQYYGGTGVDASLLQLAHVGYLDFDELKVVAEWLNKHHQPGVPAPKPK